MAIAILSFQAKKQKTFASVQLISTTLFAISFFMLELYVGAMLNCMAAVRALIYSNKKKLHADKPIWLVSFILAYLGAYALTVTVFAKEALTAFDYIINILPVVGMIASHLALYINSDKAVRRFSLVSSPLWLVYNAVSKAWGAVGCEAISLVSIVIGIIRHDIDRDKKNKK